MVASNGDEPRRKALIDQPTQTWKEGHTTGSPTKIAQRRRLGRFELEKTLGKGAFGTVYLAHDSELDRKIALKIPHAGRLTDEEDVQRFLREARAAGQLQHKNVVRVLETGKVGDHYYIASEFVDGETLKESLKRKTSYGRVEATKIVLQLAEALHAAHSRGIIHRDVKPGNVMLAKDGTPMLMDFGLARRDEDELLRTQEGARMGTPAYMSPEQAAGRSHEADARSDLWSLGVLLYELLTGRRPFEGSNLVETLKRVSEDDPVSLRRIDRRIPRDLETICLKCLAKKPESRYASTQHLADDLRRWVESRPIHARRTGGIERAGKWVRRHPVWTTLTGITMTVLLSTIVYLQTRPAYLNLRVSPADATVTLDGEQIELEEGHVLLQRPPGRYRLEIAAPGFHVQEQQVNLIRGRNNEVALNADLKSTRGHFFIATKLPGAAVKVFDVGGQEVDSGTTPHKCKPLPAGTYTVELSRELYQPHRLTVTVPDGGRTNTLKPVELRSMEESKDYIRLRNIVATLDEPIGKWEFIDTTLKDFLANVAVQQKIQLLVDYQALIKERIQHDVLINRRLRDMSFGAAMRQVLKDLNLMLVPLGDSGARHFRVTTASKADGTYKVILFPVKDLVNPEGKFRLDMGELIARIKSNTSGPWFDRHGIGGSIQANPNSDSLTIRNSWHVHVAIYRFLQQIRATGAKSLPKIKLASDRPFLWRNSSSPPGYSLRIGLGARHPNLTRLTALNNKGEFVGTWLWDGPKGKPIPQATLWRQGRRYGLGVLLGGNRSVANSINDKSQIIGWSNSANNRTSVPFLYRDGRLTELEASRGADRVSAIDINNHGHIVGSRSTSAKQLTRTFIYQDGRTIDLGIAPGKTGNMATAINGKGQVVGWSSFNRRIGNRVAMGVNAFLYEKGKIRHLNMPSGATMSRAQDINDKGQIVGFYFLANGKSKAFLYENGRIRKLDTPSSGSFGIAAAINENGQIVGSTSAADNQRHAVLYQDGRIYDLHPKGWRSSVAEDINDHGWIIGYGRDAANRYQVFLLKPVKGEKPVLSPRAVQVHRMTGHKGSVRFVVFSPDGNTAFSAGADKTIRQWDVKTGDVLRQFKGHTGGVNCIAVSRDGQRLLSASDDKTLRLWEVKSTRTIHTFVGHASTVFGVALTPDGKQAVSCSYDKTVRIWNLSTGQIIRRFQNAGTWLRSVAVSSDGRLAVTGSGDKSPQVWDINTGRIIRRLTDHTSQSTTVAFSPNGKQIATGSFDRTVRLWNVETGKSALPPFKGHTKAVHHVEFSRDGKRIVSTGYDGKVCVWDASSGTKLYQFSHTKRVQAATFSPDGKFVLSAGDDETVRLWRLE